MAGEGAQTATGQPCPACGVNVAAGYPRCPKCQTAMPGVPATGAVSASHRIGAGGTSAADTGPGILPWIAGGVGVGVLAVVLVMTLRGGGGGSADDAVTTPAPLVEPGDELAARPGLGGGARADTLDVDDVAPDEEPSAAEAIRVLGAALRGRNLWSQVRDGDDGVVVIQSSLCEDEGMGEVLAEEAGSLTEAGFVTVRCVAPHGGVVFERGL